MNHDAAASQDELGSQLVDNKRCTSTPLILSGHTGHAAVNSPAIAAAGAPVTAAGHDVAAGYDAPPDRPRSGRAKATAESGRKSTANQLPPLSMRNAHRSLILDSLPSQVSRSTVGGSLESAAAAPRPPSHHSSTANAYASSSSTARGAPHASDPSVKDAPAPQMPQTPVARSHAAPMSPTGFVMSQPAIGVRHARQASVSDKPAATQHTRGRSDTGASHAGSTVSVGQNVSAGPSHSGSRRATFQGKAALMTSVARRMSSTERMDPAALVDGSPNGAGTPHLIMAAASPGTQRFLAGVGNDALLSPVSGVDPAMASYRSQQGSLRCVEKPVIHMYPRRTISSNNSLISIGTAGQHRNSSQAVMQDRYASLDGSVDPPNAFATSARLASVIETASKDKLGMTPPAARRPHLALAGGDMVGSAPHTPPHLKSFERYSRTPSPLVTESRLKQPSGGLVGERPHVASRQSWADESVFQSDDEQDEELEALGDLPPTMHEGVSSRRPTTANSEASRPASTVGPIDEGYRNNPEYYEYLMLSQRHSSSNFIHKIDSAEVIWMANKSSIKLIGSYLLGKQIGKGSFGKVKEGLCSETLQRVAIKIINKTRVKRSANGIQGVIQEIKLLKRLKHPNVITLIDVFCKVQAVDDEEQVGIFNWFSTIEDEPILWQMEDGTQEEHHVEVLKWYLVFEYCPCSLQTLIDQSSENLLATGQGQRFFQQLMQGVDYLHSQNIVHRDIKPGNMLITPDGVLKITDFGIAEQFSMYDMKPMRINNFAGTHQFLSPEITAGSLSFDGPKADVWACGITLYYMLTRRFPFDFDEELNLLSLYERIANGAFEMPAEFPADLQELMTQILHRDPKLRASVQDVLKHAWAQKPVLLTLKTLEPFLTYPVPPEEAAPSTPVSPLKMPVLPGQPAPKGKAAPPPRPVVPCITTLIPYLEELFMEEIEQTLATRGSLGTYGFVPASKSAPTSPQYVAAGSGGAGGGAAVSTGAAARPKSAGSRSLLGRSKAGGAAWDNTHAAAASETPRSWKGFWRRMFGAGAQPPASGRASVAVDAAGVPLPDSPAVADEPRATPLM